MSPPLVKYDDGYCYGYAISLHSRRSPTLCKMCRVHGDHSDPRNEHHFRFLTLRVSITSTSFLLNLFRIIEITTRNVLLLYVLKSFVQLLKAILAVSRAELSIGADCPLPRSER